MTADKLKALLYERISEYWDGATIVWGATSKVKPAAPLVVLRLGTVTRPAQPITQMINGIAFSAYPSETTLQVDLFTRGEIMDVSGGMYTSNTAINDLLDFVNFLDSPATVEWSNRHDIALLLMNGVQDLSEVINDSQWQYRAMVELAVSFTQWTAEYNGILSENGILFDDSGRPVGVVSGNWKQTPSGGGTPELADESAGFFEKVEITRIEEGNNG